MFSDNLTVDLLWRQYKETEDFDLRQALIEEYASLVKYIVDRISVNLPNHIDKDDLLIVGIIGLIDAIEKFDLSFKVKFETYASRRIRGAVLDELRAMDWLTRSSRKNANDLEHVISKLEEELGRVPEESEIASEMHVSTEKVRDIFSEVSGAKILSLDFSSGPDDSSTLLDTLVDKKNPTPCKVIEQEDIKKIFMDLMELLSEQERNVLALYYFEGLVLKEIGAVLNISESRVSQIHAKAILHLRSKLRSHCLDEESL